MATFAVGDLAKLDPGWVLAPERYDPRRAGGQAFGSTVGTFAQVVSDQVDRLRADPERRYLVLDTGDAQEGAIRIRRPAIGAQEIGSNKKRVRPGDVIISRLRPYLRQVAAIDAALFNDVTGPADVLVSTEFFVLRSRDEASISFLVPILLSAPVQDALAAAQEGGHHPRFTQQTLEIIGVPDALVSDRERLSAAVDEIVRGFRNSDLAMRSLLVMVRGALFDS